MSVKSFCLDDDMFNNVQNAFADFFCLRTRWQMYMCCRAREVEKGDITLAVEQDTTIDTLNSEVMQQEEDSGRAYLS